MIGEGHLRFQKSWTHWLDQRVQVRVLLVHLCNFSGVTGEESAHGIFNVSVKAL